MRKERVRTDKKLSTKKISIGSYITVGTILLILLTMSIMLFVINVLSDSAQRSYIRSHLSSSLQRNNWKVSYENGEVLLQDGFEPVNDENMHFLIIDREGKIYAGYYPEEIPEEEIPGPILRRNFLITDEVYTFELGEKEYYLLDKVQTYLTRKTGRTMISRCIVEKASIASPFKNLWRLTYLSIPVILLVACVFGNVIARMVAKPIRQLCDAAGQIRSGNDLSQRMNYTGRFREIAILSEANNRMLDQLEKAFQSQKRFNSDVAHELRTPMAVVLAQCEAVMDQDCGTEKYKEALEVVHRQAVRTNDIVRQLLRLSRLEENQVVMEKEYVDLVDLIQSVCEEEEIKSRGGAEFRLNLEEVSASVDVTLMTILVQNLVQNAVKYSGEKALVEIELRRGEKGILLTVKDHGRGIPPEDQKYVFDPFFRSEKARCSGGFGLGLSIASRIAELHGGTIDLESTPGKGSSFILSLPDDK